MVFKFKFRSYKNYLDKNIEEKVTIKKKMNIFCKKLSKNTISKNEKKNEKEMKTKQNKLKLQMLEGIWFRLSSRCKVTTGSKLELVPCLEEDRIDRKCLGREIDNERVEMPLECRSLADLCTRNRRRRKRAGGEGKGGHNAGCFPRMAFTPSPRLSPLARPHRVATRFPHRV